VFSFEFSLGPEYSAREGHWDLFGTDTRPSRDEVQEPQEGERISSEIFDAPGDRNSEEPGFTVRACTCRPKLEGGSPANAGCRRERVTLKGNETQGRLESDRFFGRQGTTDFHGDESLGDGRGSAWLGSAVPFELTSGRLDAPRGCVLAVEGEPFEGQIPGALPSET